MIKLQHIRKVFNRNKSNQVLALNDVSLNLPEKGLVVLFGASGSGKTTLLNILGGLDKPTSGVINFDGEEFSKYKHGTWDHLRNENIGYIFQNYYLQTNLTVYDNVKFSLQLLGVNDEALIEERVRYVLKQVNMDLYRNKLAAHLSGGQQQRVAIARALVKNPRVIIADEPTGNLDSQNRTEVMNIIKKISHKSLVILVTHDPNIAKFYADRIIEIVDGVIVGDNDNDISDNEKHISNFEMTNHDNNIYLKDLPIQKQVKKDNLTINYYSDQEINDDLSLKLVIRNQNLFIEVDGKVSQINIVKDSDRVKLIDKKREVKTREEATYTDFTTEALSLENTSRSRKSIINFKMSMLIALRRVFSFGRRGKMALFGFLIAGAVFAYASVSLLGLLLISADDYSDVDKNALAVSVSLSEGKPANLANDLKELLGDDINVYYNTGNHFQIASRLANLPLIGGNNYYYSPRFTINHIDDSDYKGVITENEVVITSKIFNEAIGINSSSQISVIGIYNESDLIGETIYIGNQQFVIKDILKSNTSYVYLSSYELIHKVTSTYINDGIEYPEDEYIRRIIEDPVMSSFYISNYNTTKEEAMSIIRDLNLVVVDPYERAIETANSNRNIRIATTLPVNLILLGISLVGFYFIMRSSMFSRIYQIGLYRVLGVRRKEIVNSFLVEIILITTITSLIGYIVSFNLFETLSQITLVSGVSLTTSVFTFLGGILFMYLFYIIIGLLPVFNLLRLTPSELITKYDI